jgi:hypothetical protein
MTMSGEAAPIREGREEGKKTPLPDFREGAGGGPDVGAGQAPEEQLLCR